MTKKQPKQQSKLTLIVRSVPFCGACTVMQTQLNGEGVPYETIDISAEPEAVKQYSLTGVPTMLIEDANGELTDRLVGVHPVDAIKAKLKGGR